jgi:Flp pilus assembly protein CpaB
MLRRSPRALALWAAAGVVALVTASVVASDLASIHRRAADLGPIVRAVVATRDLALGATLRPSDVGERDVYRSQLPREAVVGAAGVTGRVVAVPVVRGAFVVEGNLASRRRSGLDGVVPAGMRAMRVVATTAVRPRPGAAVDVLATFDTASAPGSVSAASTVTVAAGVLVVAVDPVTSDSNDRVTLGVTLLVDVADAARVAFAQANGVVTIALVPPEAAARR